MTRDGIIQDISETKRRLMSGDFTPKQSETLIGFVNEQIKDYCHSKVDQRIFENWLKDYLKEKFKVFEQNQVERFKSFHTKEDQRIFEYNLNEKIDARFERIESRMDKFEENMEKQSLALGVMMKKLESQSLAIAELTQKISNG